ncbi:protein Bouncer-like [Syngnathoides biaculeatus]|uniref:protein Bouncer-like n=1 Tax=Syngnathoides biaculeatus TaxID=300417 RepID=UPI002ADD5074|nr:protein Bouncer-like [Syngnathoides biaculeatus]
MTAQKKQSLTLASIMMAAVLFSAVGQRDNFLCYFCPLQPKDAPCPNVATECAPGQRCATTRGYYGVVQVLSSQGCLDAPLCGTSQVVYHMGVEYLARHSCCCKDKCNVPPTSKAILKMLLGMIMEKAYANATRALRGQLQGSCGDDPVTPATSASVK